MTTTTSPGTSGAFALALSKFKKTLNNEQIQAFTGSSLEDIQKEAGAIQAIQEKKGVLRNMRRIQPLITGLKQFSGVIEVFVQSKPDVLAFIWGPIKFLLQIASTYTETYDKLLNAFQTIGESLSRFQMFEGTFYDVPRMQNVLVMIYEDILQFYQVTLSYFRVKDWRKVFIRVWRTFDDEFGGILSNLERHKALVDTEATATDIVEARAARKAAHEAEEAARIQRDKQNIIKIREWLSPVDYGAVLTKLGNPCKRTGLWFIQENGVQAWLDMADKARRLLWLTGIPGSGKTFLSSSILTHARSIYNYKSTPIAYAFLRDNDSSTSATIIQTIIAQLLPYNHKALTYLEEKRESNLHPPRLQEELQEMLEIMLEGIGITYIFIDGLDEIDIQEREMVLETLCFLLPKAENLKVFLSSRYEVDIVESLARIAGHIYQVDIGGKNQGDIETYVTEEGQAVFKKFSLDDTTRREIQIILDRVRDDAKGMFLWARLVIYDLKSQYDMEGLEEAARNLPIGLDAAYGRILNRINEKLSARERDLAKRVLAWVMCSTRPLSLNELKQAMAIREGDNCMNQRRRILIRLDELCGPIVEFDVGENIHFVHFTAKEYLTSEYSSKFIRRSDAHQDMAITCMTYLSFTCFDTNTPDEEVKKSVMSGEYCLHQYAERSWLDHVKHAIEMDKSDSWTKSLIPLLNKFVVLRLGQELPHTMANLDNLPKERFLNSLNCYDVTCGGAVTGGTVSNHFKLQISMKRFREHLEDIFTSLSMLNDQENLRSLHRNYGENIFKCSQVNCAYYIKGFDTKKKRDKHFNTHTRPFKCHFRGCDFVSIGFGSPGALETHIYLYHPVHASDTQTRGPSNLSTSHSLENSDLTKVLFEAISTGDFSIVKGVLESEMDLNCFNENGKSALHCALKARREDIFQLLLEKGASANVVDNKTKTIILNSALSQGLERYALLLLEWGADVNKMDHFGNLPLARAIHEGSHTLVKSLLEKGADANTIDSAGYPALMVAIRTHRTELVELLLEGGADVELLGPEGSALVFAIKNSHAEIVKLLIEGGADVHSRNLGTGESALIEALRLMPSDIVRLLLERGADANTSSLTGTPALTLGILSNGMETVQLLLEHGADPDLICTLTGNTALIDAIAIGLVPSDIVKSLLDRGANPNALNHTGTPALLLAIKNDQTEIVQLLLDHRADPHAKDQIGNAAVIHAILRRSTGITKLLLKNGVSANTISSVGTPALIVAIQDGQTKTVQLLLEYGADPHSKDHLGDAAILHAVFRRSFRLTKLLLDKGADANATDTRGISALILAIMGDQRGVVHLPLETESFRDRMDIVELLLDREANVNQTDSKGVNILVLVLQLVPTAANYDLFRLILTRGKGVNLNHKNDALRQAISQRLIHAFEILIDDGGADVNVRDAAGRTPLIVAASMVRSDRSLLRKLLGAGADVDARDKDKKSALLVASQSDMSVESRVERFKVLLEYKANINMTDSNGRTALHEMAVRKLRAPSNVLLEHGARYDIEDNNGKTALTISPQFGPVILSIAERIRSESSR